MTRKPDTFHVIIAGDSSAGRSFTFSRRHVRNISCVVFAFLVLLSVGTWHGFTSFRQNKVLADLLADTSAQLEDLSNNFATELDRKEEELTGVFQSRIDLLAGELDETTAELNTIARRHADTVQHYESQLKSLRQDHENALEQSISKLNERSQAIESMMDRIGVSVKGDRKKNASGGPYIAIQPDTPQKLLQQSGKFLELLKKTPLGKPVNGKIGSGFGRRLDPFTNREAMHSGIDFEGIPGTRVVATADGVATEVSFDKGGYGHFVRIRHGNGYETLYAHLLKPQVQPGEGIKRGQLIGLLGNSGRSTGPHLHYEILLNGRPINPAKYIATDTKSKSRQTRHR